MSPRLVCQHNVLVVCYLVPLRLFDALVLGSQHGYGQHNRQMVAPAEPDLLFKNLPQPRGDAIF